MYARSNAPVPQSGFLLEFLGLS